MCMLSEVGVSWGPLELEDARRKGRSRKTRKGDEGYGVERNTRCSCAC
jgi:hypothetical protein